MLKQKFIVQFGSNFILKLLGMIAGLFVARVAGPEVVGTITFGTAYVSIFGFITVLFSTGHIKAISEGQDLGKCVTTYNWLMGLSVSFYFIFVLAWFLFQKYIIQYNFESNAQQVVIIILLFVQVASEILDIGNVTFTATLEQAKANYPLFFKSLSWHIGRILIVILGFKAVGLVSWNLLITVLSIPLAWRFYKKLPRGRFSVNLAKKYFLIVPSVLLYRIFESLIHHSDKLFLVHYASVEELGYYAAAFSVGGMFQLISNSVGIIFFPYFSHLISQKRWDLLNVKLQTYQSFITIFVFPFICVIAIVGEPILPTLLGTRYQPSVTPFFIILFATYVSILGMPYGNIIAGMGRFYTISLITGVKFIFFVVGLTVFVSPMFLNLGATGLALNLLWVNFSTNLLFYFFSRYYGQVVFDWVNFWRHLLVFLIMGCVLYLTFVYDLNQNFLWLITGLLFLFTIYITLFAFRLIHYYDFKQMIDLLNINKTKKYIKDEFSQ